MEAYYKIKKLEIPEWVRQAKEYYSSWFYTVRSLDEICSNTNIPKNTMEYWANLEPTDMKALQNGLIDKDFRVIIKKMYEELVSNKEEYFVTEWTLSKKGRKRMREYRDAINSAGIKMSQNEFNNVPGLVTFTNRIYSFDAEYELFVSFDGSRIGLRNGGDNEVYMDFTERFLDLVIPMMQWERFRNMLHKKDRGVDREDSVYQDFRTVLVDINWNEYDLDLLEYLEGNPFIQLLKLVWEEYGEVLRGKDMVLPWFATLGWV